MNDSDPFRSSDSADPIDRTLSAAFASRRVAPMSAPSLMDVRHRARRRQQRRTAGLVGAITLVGAGGVGAYSLRHDDGRAALSPGDADGNGAPATTIACVMSTTTVPPLPTVSTISIIEPTVLPTTGGSVEFMPLYSTTIAPPAFDPCAPGGWTWHCTGELGTDEFGRQIFESCEQVEPGLTSIPTIPGELVPSSTAPGQPIGTTTTMYPGECPPGSYCGPPPGLTVPPTTVPTSVNGNVGEPDATSTTNVVYESTTTSLG